MDSKSAGDHSEEVYIVVKQDSQTKLYQAEIPSTGFKTGLFANAIDAFDEALDYTPVLVDEEYPNQNLRDLMSEEEPLDNEEEDLFDELDDELNDYYFDQDLYLLINLENNTVIHELELTEPDSYRLAEALEEVSNLALFKQVG